MARRRQADGERYIEADNGFGWTPDAESGRYETTVFGIEYELEKRRGDGEGWHLYTRKGSHFWGEWCAYTLLEAVDEASKMIAKADLRGEGYEKETET